MFMKTNIIKKAVSVLACVSILAGCAATSNAVGGPGKPKYWFNLRDKEGGYSLVHGNSKEIFTYNGPYDDYLYKYDVSYIHYSGCATGAYLPGLKVKVGGKYVCDVNTPKYWGAYKISGSNSGKYTLNNGAKQDVGMTMHFYVGEYY